MSAQAALVTMPRELTSRLMPLKIKVLFESLKISPVPDSIFTLHFAGNETIDDRTEVLVAFHPRGSTHALAGRRIWARTNSFRPRDVWQSLGHSDRLGPVANRNFARPADCDVRGAVHSLNSNLPSWSAVT